MGFFRKKQVGDAAVAEKFDGPLAATITRTDVIAETARPFTAAELAPLVRKSAAAWGDDWRLYLIIASKIGRDGFAPDWQFHVLYPALRAEGVWSLGASADGTESTLSMKLHPVPEPGTTEFLMAQLSDQLARDQTAAWDARVERILSLPSRFADSPDVIEAIEHIHPAVFSTGPIRVKARTLPNGDAVWEWSGNDLIHVAFEDPEHGEAQAIDSAGFGAAR